MNLRVLVVDDTAVFRRLIQQTLEAMPGVEVVGTASNGRLALTRIAALRPDLVTLDIEMPEMNGLELLEAMQQASLQPAVIVVSSRTARGGEMTVRALELGAFDFLTKPEGGTPADNLALLRERLSTIMQAFERRRDVRTLLYREPRPEPCIAEPCIAKPSIAKPPTPEPRPEPRAPVSLEAPRAKPVPVKTEPPATKRLRRGSPLVLIGVSTGGPAALAQLLPALPANLGAPVVIVQHMPAMFTQQLAASLDRKSKIPVKEAKDGETAVANCVYLAPGSRQLKVEPGPQGEFVLRITDDQPENGCKPAVDYLFRSAALRFPGRTVAVILTGMGKDGTAGLRMLKRGGCISIAQDEASSVVFGMPKEAIAAGLVDRIAPLDLIAGEIVRSIRENAP